MSTTPRIPAGLHALTGGLPRAFWFIWLGIFVNRIGSFVMPFLAIYLTQVHGLSIVHAGLVAALYGAGTAVAGPVGGYLADHVGRRFTMVLALGLGGTGMMVLGLAHRVEIIAPMTFVVALVGEMYRPAMQAAVADLVPADDRVRAFGLVYWVINMGFAIGLAIGGLLATVSYTLLFVGDGLTSVIFGLIVWCGVPETKPMAAPHQAGVVSAPAPGGFFAPFRDAPYVLFLVLNMLTALVFLQFTAAMPLDMTAHGVSRAAFGLVIGLNGLIVVLVQPFLGPVLARRDRSRTIALGSVMVASGFGINAFASTAPVFALGVVVWSIGEMYVLPLGSAIVAELAPRALRGRYQGALGFSWGVASCAAPALGTYVLQHHGGTWLWSGCLMVGVLVGAGHLALGPALTREIEARRAAEAGVPA